MNRTIALMKEPTSVKFNRPFVSSLLPRHQNESKCKTILMTMSFTCIGNCRNVRGLGKSKVVFRLFEKLRYSMKDQLNSSLYPEYKYLEEENGKLFKCHQK